MREPKKKVNINTRRNEKGKRNNVLGLDAIYINTDAVPLLGDGLQHMQKKNILFFYEQDKLFI